VELIVQILAQRAFAAEETARYQAQRECDQRWFRTLDSHIRLLDRERQKFAAIVNQTDTFVYVTDDSGRIRWSNRAMGELCPPPDAPGSWIGKSCQDVCGRVGVDCDECPVAKSTADTRVVHQELRAQVEGGPGFLYLTALPILGPNGKADETLVMIQDLTGLEGLRRSEERLRTVIGSAPIVLFALDPDGTLTLSEGRGLEALGLKPGEAVGKSALDLYTDFPDVVGTVRRALAGEEFEADVELGPLAFRTRYAPLYHPDGTLKGVIGVATDITERQAAQRALQASEAALKKSEEQLRQAQKMEAIGVLAGGVAHDFNNLLTVIMTQSGLLAKSLLPGSPAAQKAEEILAASARGAMLTRQLLTFSRNEVLAPKVLDLNAVVAELETMLRGVIGEDVEFSSSLDAGGVHVRADKGQVEQVVMNLVVNARDAMPHGGRLQLSVARETIDGTRARELDTAGPGVYCAIAVQDTGTGMDQETLGRIFEPFFTTKGRGKGTGLGLSTVYGILKQGGGSIMVESEPGKGSKFTAYFPHFDGAADEDRLQPGRTTDARGSETILLVEDEPGVRAIAKELLEMTGYTVLEAENGADALEVARRFEGDIDLLISDVIMPRVGGRELAERLGAARPAMRVLFVSGFTDDTIARHGVLEEGVAFLQKPFTLETLSQKVREILDSSQPGSPAQKRRASPSKIA
jgi:PAS domain S-box-containing protein